MKKSKAIKLVLVTGLLGAGTHASANLAHKLNCLITKSPIGKSFKNFNAPPSGYFKQDDTASHSVGGGFAHTAVIRGGWGSFGHHSCVS